MKAREKLKAWIESSGMKQVQVAEEIGTTAVRLHRLIFGRGTLEPAQLARLESLTGLDGLAIQLASEAPRPRKAPAKRAARPAHQAAPEPAPAAELAPVPRRAANVDVDKLAVVLADRMGAPTEAVPIVTVMVELALTARNEGQRRQAAQDIIDRVAGKPLQRVLDTTPRPPAESPELLELLERLGGRKPQEPSDPELPVALREVPRA